MRRWRTAAVAIALALLSVVIVWQLDPPTVGASVVVALLAIPILAPLRGLWRGHRQTYRWATLCVIPYLVVALTEVIASPATRAWSIATLTLAFTWFLTLIAFLRVSGFSKN